VTEPSFNLNHIEKVKVVVIFAYDPAAEYAPTPKPFQVKDPKVESYVGDPLVLKSTFPTRSFITLPEPG